MITVAGHYGSLTVNANGTYSYVADATAINALHAGTYADTFTVQTTDVHGATGSATLTVNVTGANDAPTLSAVTTGPLVDTAGYDNFGNITGTLVGNDLDSGETAMLTYAALDGSHQPVHTAVAGHYGSLTVDAYGVYSYVPNAAAINALREGDLHRHLYRADHGRTRRQRQCGLRRECHRNQRRAGDQCRPHQRDGRRR